ncbi:MAG: YdeI/OmpD-associated family protein [Acidobacteriota bacterium]
MSPTMGKVVFFESPAEFRRWLEKHHATTGELWVGYYKKHTAKPSLTWPESVDQALCFGWIDGIRRRIDELAYAIRFTPRKPRSNWSAVNCRRAQELIGQGLMRPPGLKAFQARDKELSDLDSQRPERLAAPYETKIKRIRSAWAFYQSQSVSYRKAVNAWILSAKKEETRLKRLERLIEDSARGERIPPLARPKPPA